MSVRRIRARSAASYRERLSPSLWVLVGAALCAPMAALVFMPLDTTVALVIGGLVGVALLLLLSLGSPVVEISDGELRAGRAHIDTAYLGDVQTARGDDARIARGPGLHPRSWHLIRGGVDGIVVVSVIDPDDPAPSWVISSRMPDRLAAAITRSQLGRALPADQTR